MIARVTPLHRTGKLDSGPCAKVQIAGLATSSEFAIAHTNRIAQRAY